MTALLDTNVLLRSVEPIHAHHPTAVRAVRDLIARGETLCVVPQVLYEFWVVATRPIRNGGLEWSPAATARVLAEFEQIYPLLIDPPDLYRRWRELVTTHGVSGKPAHDARLVAAMNCHSIPALLTFNTAGFKRFGGIMVRSPGSIP